MRSPTQRYDARARGSRDRRAMALLAASRMLFDGALFVSPLYMQGGTACNACVPIFKIWQSTLIRCNQNVCVAGTC